VESLFAIGDDVVGLSLTSCEVRRDGTIAISTGQRCSIFQLECKIKEKVCKLVIDGGSFTNAIRCCACTIFVHMEASYAVVYAMDEYMWYIEN
jgi:hypothetical protein